MAAIVSVTVVGAQDHALEAQLRASGLGTSSIRFEDLQDLAHPSNTPPDVVVLDLRGQSQIPAALAQLKRHHADTAIIVVTDALDPALMLEAMRAGVSEYVTNLTGGELEAAIRRLVTLRAAPEIGDVFAFVGAKGGVGTTTAAVNVATALSQSGSVLLIDLHLLGGDAALLFGAEPRFSVSDALENTHRLDTAYFRGLVTRTKAGPDLLASAERAVSVADAAHVRAVIDFAARHYRYTVLDLSRYDSGALDSLEAAAPIIVVANQELPTVRAAARLASMLRSRYGKEKVSVALSRSDREAEIGRDDLERAVGGPVTYTFPSDYRAALEGLNRGRPIVLENHASLALAFQTCARRLAGAGSTGASAEKQSTQSKGAGLLGRLTGRR